MKVNQKGCIMVKSYLIYAVWAMATLLLHMITVKLRQSLLVNTLAVYSETVYFVSLCCATVNQCTKWQFLLTLNLRSSHYHCSVRRQWQSWQQHPSGVSGMS